MSFKASSSVSGEWLAIESDITQHTCRLEDIREVYIVPPVYEGTDPSPMSPALSWRLFLVVARVDKPAFVLIASEQTQSLIERDYRRVLRELMKVRNAPSYTLYGSVGDE